MNLQTFETKNGGQRVTRVSGDDRLEILKLGSRAEYAESHHEQSHDRKTRDGACRADMTEHDIKTLRGGAEATE
nr:hypothetical protein [Tanacetum cinerariifolium]